MKPFVKAIIFLVILSAFDILLRKGLILQVFPMPLPQNISALVLFALFAFAALLLTHWFARRDGSLLKSYGISLSKKNKQEFFYGLVFGIFIWGAVSLAQSAIAGFSWELRPNFDYLSLFHGLLFIFFADLGTELYYRAYPLVNLKNSFGSHLAVVIMAFFVGLISFSFELEGAFLMYTLLIPFLHTLFFSFIYFKTKRLGAALGIHTGANFVTISIFDLRTEQAQQAIPSGMFQSNADLATLSLHDLQLPWIVVAVLFSAATYFWWKKSKSTF